MIRSFVALLSWAVGWAATVGVIAGGVWLIWWILPGTIPIAWITDPVNGMLNGVNTEYRLPAAIYISMPPSPASWGWPLLWVAAVPLVFSWLTWALTPLGNRFKATGRAQRLPAHHPLSRAVTQLGTDTGAPMPAVWVIEDNRPNAFAMSAPGFRRAVGFSTGLLNLCTPDELEWVAAHELGHLYHRDSAGTGLWVAGAQWNILARRWRQAVLNGVLNLAARLPLLRLLHPLLWLLFSVLVGVVDHAERIARGTFHLIDRQLARRAEYRADEFAKKAVGPASGVTVLEKLSEFGRPLPDLFSTHPAVENRIARLEKQD